MICCFVYAENGASGRLQAAASLGPEAPQSLQEGLGGGGMRGAALRSFMLVRYTVTKVLVRYSLQ